MKAGKLRHWGTFQNPVYSDVFGTPKSYVNYRIVWISIEPLRGREYWEAYKENSEVTTKVTGRYLPGIKPSMRILAGGKTYEIVSVIDPEMKHAEMILMVKEVA